MVPMAGTGFAPPGSNFPAGGRSWGPRVLDQLGRHVGGPTQQFLHHSMRFLGVVVVRGQSVGSIVGHGSRRLQARPPRATGRARVGQAGGAEHVGALTHVRAGFAFALRGHDFSFRLEKPSTFANGRGRLNFWLRRETQSMLTAALPPVGDRRPLYLASVCCRMPGVGCLRGRPRGRLPDFSFGAALLAANFSLRKSHSLTSLTR